MIAYRQAREKLIERVWTFTTESPIGPLQGYAYARRSIPSPMSRSSITASATARTC